MRPKGIISLYDYCCDNNFYEWFFSEEYKSRDQRIFPRLICMAPVYFKDDGILTLKEEVFDPNEERNSTWKITDFDEGPRNSRLPHRPYKEFQLEKDDDLMVLKCKIRPVLAIKELKCDWRMPYKHFMKFWLCLPIFSYRPRHPQSFVISDQRLEAPIRFYFPPGTPGLAEEGAALISGLQCIPERNLYPYKCFCDLGDTPMDRPVKLGDYAFKAVVGHLSKLLPEIEISGSSKEWYDFFKELVNEEIDKLSI